MDIGSLPPKLIVRWDYISESWRDDEDSQCDVDGCTNDVDNYEITFGDDSEESEKMLAEMEDWGRWFLVCEEHKNWLMENCNKA